MPAQTRLLLLLTLCLSGCADNAAQISISTVSSAASAGFVDASIIVPTLQTDIRYFGNDNFIGAPVSGYLAAKCLLQRPVAEALARVQQDLQQQGFALLVFDCYRPVMAVQHFVVWADDLGDQKTKPDYYPNLDKSQLLGDYIAERSGHSRGATLDLTLLDCRQGACQPLDMGTPFDFFDERAHTESPLVSEQARGNRLRLRNAMGAQGFHNYPLEWWHYTFRPEPTPTIEYNFPVQ